MKQISAKLLLKHHGEDDQKKDTEIFEEAVVVMDSDSVTDMKEQINDYVKSLNEDQDEVIELISIVDYAEVEEKTKSSPVQEVYSRFLDEHEVRAY